MALKMLFSSGFSLLLGIGLATAYLLMEITCCYCVKVINHFVDNNIKYFFPSCFMEVII